MNLDWSIFDRIYCIHYLPYTERLSYISRELDRVDILNSKNFEFYYTVPNKYYDFIFLSHKNFKNYNNTIYNKTLNIDINLDTPEATDSDIDFRFINNTNINYTINTLDLLYQIKCFGYKKVLILEDDVFFLQDKKILEKYISKIPEQFDVINFDPFIYDKSKYKVEQYNECYLNTLKSELYNASCVALTDKAMDFILKCQSKMLLPYDNYITYKGIENDDLVRFIPNKNICIQRDYKLRQEYYYQNTTDSKYKNMNVIMEEYTNLENIDELGTI